MAQEVLVILAVVIPDEPPESRGKIHDLRGRELPGVPGSWVTRVAVHAPHLSVAATAPEAAVGHRHQTPASTGSAGSAGPPGGAPAEAGLTEDEREHELDLDYGTNLTDDS